MAHLTSPAARRAAAGRGSTPQTGRLGTRRALGPAATRCDSTGRGEPQCDGAAGVRQLRPGVPPVLTGAGAGSARPARPSGSRAVRLGAASELRAHPRGGGRHGASGAPQGRDDGAGAAPSPGRRLARPSRDRAAGRQSAAGGGPKNSKTVPRSGSLQAPSVPHALTRAQPPGRPRSPPNDRRWREATGYHSARARGIRAGSSRHGTRAGSQSARESRALNRVPPGWPSPCAGDALPGGWRHPRTSRRQRKRDTRPPTTLRGSRTGMDEGRRPHRRPLGGPGRLPGARELRRDS